MNRLAHGRRLRILTWHVHGNYLYYLSHVPHDFYLVTKPGHPPGHAGRVGAFEWGDNIREVDCDAVKDCEFDCVLVQSRAHWEADRETYLSEHQRLMPTIVIEHDPPQQHAVDTCHWAAGRNVLLVHVTAFNRLMWHHDGVATRVIEHGVTVPPEARYVGDHACGLVVVNHLAGRGRRLGSDLFVDTRRLVPLDLVGMDAESLGGIGEVSNPDLPAFMARYRFFFHPARWTSLGLAVIEAMAVGLPIVGLATTELSTVIERGVNGYIDTDPAMLVVAMRELLDNRALAIEWGQAGRRTATERFSIDRFVDDWTDAFADVTT